MRVPLPPLEPLSQGELWWIKVRTARVCRERVPLEATLSYPVPGPGVLYCFHSLPSADSAARRRIFTRITATVPDLQIVEFRTAREGHLFPGLPEEVLAEPPGHDGPTEKALLRIYPTLVQCYPDSPAGALGGQFLEALERLVPAALLPYYEALNPHFFDWCQRG